MEKYTNCFLPDLPYQHQAKISGVREGLYETIPSAHFKSNQRLRKQFLDWLANLQKKTALFYEVFLRETFASNPFYIYVVLYQKSAKEQKTSWLFTQYQILIQKLPPKVRCLVKCCQLFSHISFKPADELSWPLTFLCRTPIPLHIANIFEYRTLQIHFGIPHVLFNLYVCLFVTL